MNRRDRRKAQAIARKRTIQASAPTSLGWAVPVSIQAAATGEPNGRRKFSLVAYTGEPMRIYGYRYPVVIDCATLDKSAQRIPALYDHSDYGDSIVGQIEAVNVIGSTINADGYFTPTDEPDDRSRKVLAKADAGFQWQASVGANPGRLEEIQAGSKVTVNGRSYMGPVFVSRDTVLREISFVALGADRNTSATLRAQRLKGGRMDLEAWILSQGFDPSTLNATQRTNLEATYNDLYGDDLVNPTTPINAGIDPEVVTLLANDPELLVQASAGRWDITKARKEKLEHLRASRGDGPAIMTSRQPVASQDMLTSAIMVRAGHEKWAEKAFGAETLNRSQHLHGQSFIDLAMHAMRADGRMVPRDRSEMIRAALSGGTLTVALNNTANKILEMQWLETRPTWRSFCAIKTAKNFKEHTGVRPTFGGNLEQREQGGSFVHGEFGEETYNYRIHNFGKMYAIDYIDVVDDDLSIFSEILPGFGKAAMRMQSDLVYGTLLSNTGDFFHTDNGNIATGAGSVLATAGLKAAIARMRLQQDPDGNNLDIVPQTLLVGPTLEYTANELINSSEIMISGTAEVRYPTINSFKNVANVEVESRIESGCTHPQTKVTHAGSATRWYLFAKPSDVPMVVAFLNGRQFPSIQSFGLDHEAETLCYKFRVWQDIGAAFGDYRAADYSAGA